MNNLIKLNYEFKELKYRFILHYTDNYKNPTCNSCYNKINMEINVPICKNNNAILCIECENVFGDFYNLPI